MTSLEDLQLKFREVTVEKLKPGADKDAIWEILETTDTLTTKQKKTYNIKRR